MVVVNLPTTGADFHVLSSGPGARLSIPVNKASMPTSSSPL
ncbi:hypothetical protein CEV33_4988 [Brucella grignonensis]|uniref:Uncharacterized protein n=1 Tax=Brucella grignonensis TaxID=94627 RepID=A0A256FSM8_9HYPH|nr:hypothetical protein CEV33_4988 [Brucella grignonensis]